MTRNLGRPLVYVRWWLLVAAVASAGLLTAVRPITAPQAAEPCPLSHGYWKTHPEAWPVRSLVLGNPSNPAHTYGQGDQSL